MLQMSVDRDYRINVIPSLALSPVDGLQRWLGGRWALLFSHPEDFATHGFEADRWIACLREELEQLDLRVIAVGDSYRRSWVSQVGGRFAPAHEVDDWMPADWHIGSDEHFVTIFDGALRARRTIVYSAGARVPSPMELAQTAAGLRSRSVGQPSWLLRNCS